MCPVARLVGSRLLCTVQCAGRSGAILNKNCNLDGEFPRGREHEHIDGGHPPRAEQQPLQQRQRKRRRLARACSTDTFSPVD